MLHRYVAIRFGGLCMSDIPIQDIQQWLDPLCAEGHRRALRNALRQARMSSRLTQTEVAACLGVPQSFVSKYESGQRRLDLVEISAVCAALRVSVSSLLALWAAQALPETSR